MSFLQAIFLAIVQGLTEFLPISSSGHLIIIQKMFQMEVPVLFDILVHVGTLMAILFYFRHRLLRISKRQILLVAIGTIPAALLGFFLDKYISQIFGSLRLVGFSLLTTSFLLLSTRKVTPAKNKKELNWLDALVVGIFQAIAILPGVSRSGATVCCGLLRKLDGETAFQFSFFLAIPAIVGALVLQLPELISSSPEFLTISTVGLFVSGIVGYFSLIALRDVLRSGKVYYFGIYCFVVGIIVILI